MYNKKGNKLNEFMQMKDFYLFAAQLSNFELLYGNKLKNNKTSGFEYFNNDSRSRLKWYLNEITKAVNNEPGNISDLRVHFKSNYTFITSLKNYLESPDYNIENKEANSSSSIVSMLTQVINNNFGATYFKYNSDGTYTVQEMYKQNFNNIQLQNTTFSKFVNNSAEDSFYDLKNTEKNVEFTALFVGMNDKDIMSSAAIQNRANIDAINKYIENKTGILLNREGFNDLIKDIEDNVSTGKITVGEFKNRLKGMMTSLNSDFKSEKFRNDLKDNLIKKASKGDTSIGDYLSDTVENNFYKGIVNAHLINFVIKPMMNVEMSSGEKLPTFKTANLTYKDTELFDLQRGFQEANPDGKFKSILIKDDAVIIGTGTKLEAVNGDTNKQAVKFSISESYISDLQFDFLKNIVKNNSFSIMIGNYSDKNTVITKIIDANYKHDGKNVLIKQDIGTIQELVRSQARNYYYDTLVDVFTDYKILFDALGIANTINPDVDKSFDSSVSQINSILEKNNIRSLLEKYTNLKTGVPINLTEELHFSQYGKRKALNQLILDNFRIFSDSSKSGLYYGKNGFIAKQEENLADKFREYTGHIEGSKHELLFTETTSDDEIKKYVEALGINPNEFPLKLNDKGEETKVRDFGSLMNGKTAINPILSK